MDAAADLEVSRHVLLSQRLRRRRRELGLTQQQVATRLARLGVLTTNKALSSLEHGAGHDVAKLPELARALDCSITYLLGLTDDPQRWEPDRDRAVPPVAEREPRARPAATARPAELRGRWILGPLTPEE